METKGILNLLFMIGVLTVLIIVLGCIIVLSCYFATHMGLTGVTWYAGVIISFLLLTGVILMLMRIGD